MERPTANILNRPGKTVRNKNHTFTQQEEAKTTEAQNHKESKMNQIHEYRRQAILGNRTERQALTKNFFGKA